MKRHNSILSAVINTVLLLLPLLAGSLDAVAQSSRLWATYYGGKGKDFGIGTATDATTGDVYLVGGTASVSNIASTGGFQTPHGGGLYDGMIVKFNAAGNRIWATYYGGAGSDWAYRVATDPSTGDIYVGGQTGSTTGISSGGFQNSYGGGSSDAFLAKFNSSGVRQWATYYGGAGADDCYGLCVDASGNVYMTGYTTSTTGVATGGFQNTYGGSYDIYLVKFNPAGVRQWATYYGANGTERNGSVSADASGNVYLSGWTNSTTGIASGGFQNTFGGGTEAFLVKFNPAGVRQWATYYGGTGDDRGFSVTNDPNTGDVYLAGTTFSPGLAIGGFQNIYSGTTFGDNFIVKFNPVGIRIWATYYGGADNQTCTIVTDAAGNVYLAGDTYSFGSSNLASGGFQNTNMSPDESCYLAKFDAAGNRLCATYYGRTHEENGNCAVDGCGNVYLSGLTPSDHDIASGGFQNIYGDIGVNDPYAIISADAFLVKFCPCNNTALNLSSTNPLCGTTCTGTATVKGIPVLCTSYSYLWSTTPAQTTQTAMGLCTGTYTVTVTNSSSCNLAQTGSITITNNGNATIATTNATCTTTGSATVYPTGGAPPYTYLWSNGQTAQTAIGLTPGNYAITVKDANGCTSTKTATITTEPPLTYTLSVKDGTCGNGGTVTVTITDGSAPFTFSWSGTNQSTETVTALPAGDYTVKVTDGNGCTATKTFKMTDTPNLASATFTQSPGGTVCTGTTVNFTNTGTPSPAAWHFWIVSISPTVNIYTENLSYTFLTAGTYTVTHNVKSTSTGCIKIEMSTVVVVNCSATPVVTATGSSVCPGTCAAITSSGVGGTAPYTYSWSNGATSQNINSCPISTTTYTVKITDSNGATATTTATIVVTPVTVSAAPTNITCSGGTNGNILATPGNGTAPYTYSWSNGQSTQTASGLAQGNYIVKVTDSKGCTATATAAINSPPPLVGQFTKGTAACPDCGCKEWLLVNAIGGTSPYTYLWPDGYVSRYKNHLCPGNYTVNIKDKNGCSVNVNINTP